jgi:hypothetical protein
MDHERIRALRDQEGITRDEEIKRTFIFLLISSVSCTGPSPEDHR